MSRFFCGFQKWEHYPQVIHVAGWNCQQLEGWCCFSYYAHVTIPSALQLDVFISVLRRVFYYKKIYSNHCVKDIPSALIDQVMFNASYHSQIPWTFRFTCNKSWTHQIQVFLWVHHGSSHSIAHFGGLNSIEAPFLRWPWCWVVSKKQQTLCEDSNGLWGWPGYMVYKCVYIIYIYINVY